MNETISVDAIVADCFEEVLLRQGKNKHLTLRNGWTEEGRPFPVIRLYHNGAFVDAYWRLPDAVKDYNALN